MSNALRARRVGSGGAPIEIHTLFLVEDHPTMRRVLRQLLDGETDLDVIGEADSAEDALEQLAALTPDLLLVDLSLPGLSGMDLVRLLKQQRPGLRCLVVTGHTDGLYRAAAEAAGATGYVTKDDPDEVLAAVRAALQA